MGLPKKHEKIKLIVGFIFKNENDLARAESIVFKKLGPLDYQSEIKEFTYTEYYGKEFGGNLKRKFISLKSIRFVEDIYKIKMTTNRIEKILSRNKKRTVNIDPGYLTLGKLVLLTTKDHSHRIYLRSGIYAESTLRFQNGTYVPWETTYPDYTSKFYIEVFNKIRALYSKQI